MLSHERLLELLRYDKETGLFIHIKKRSGVKLGSVAGAVMPVGYVYIAVDGKKYYAHRLAYFYVEKKWPIEVDHINGNKADNRWENLRAASRQQNAVNIKRRSPSRSGFRGVTRTSVGTWAASINRNGVRHYLGCFKTKEEASEARDNFAKALDGEFYCEQNKKSELEGASA